MCNKCRASKPLDAYEKSSAHGWRRTCKECRRQDKLKPEARKRAETRQRLNAKGTKRCSGCSRVLPHSEFHARVANWDGLQSKCKTCVAVYGKAYHERNRERDRERNARWYRDNADHMRRYRKAYYRLNKEKVRGKYAGWREDNREHLLAYYRQYNAEHSEEHSAYNRSPARRQKQRAHQAANKERYQRAHREYAQSEHGRAVRASIQRRREAKKKGLQTGFTVAQWDYAVSYFDRCCAYCGEHTETLQQEHYIPIARGGGYVVDNIVPACKRCNVRKGVSLPAEWMAQQAFVAQGTAKRILTYFASLSHT